MNQRDRNNIREARQHLAVLQQHLTRGELDDPLILDAVCMRLVASIEALGRLPQAHRSALFGTSWQEMASTRNRLAHAYDSIDLEIITATIRHDISPLIEKLTATLESISTQD